MLRERSYRKGENFISEGQIPRKIAFVVQELFSQNYASENGETVIKYFFPEGRLAASVTATPTETKCVYHYRYPTLNGTGI